MFSISTTDAEKQFIHSEAVRTGARRVLEIGAFKGETTAVLSRAAAECGGHVVVIDPMEFAAEALANGVGRFLELQPRWLSRAIRSLLLPFTYERAFWRNVHAVGKNNVTLFRACSTDRALIANVDPLLAEFDLVFIDGDHTYDSVLSDVRNWGGRVRPGGSILMHDVSPRFPGVVRVFEDLGSDPRFRVRTTTAGTIGALEVLAS